MNNQDRAFTLDDGTTTLTGTTPEFDKKNATDRLYNTFVKFKIAKPKEYVSYVFYGTGTSITLNAGNISSSSSYVTIDGATCNVSGVGTFTVSGLPLGHHTVQIKPK